MRKHVLSSFVFVPLLLSFSHAAQSWSVDPPAAPWVFSSEDGGSSSYVGVDITDVTTERLSALKLKEEKGVEVTLVDQDAPAGKAGIKVHDVILTMNGASVESAAQLRRMIHETPAGRVITLGLSRDGQSVAVKLQLADKHKEFAMTAPWEREFHVEVPNMPSMPEIDVPSMNVVVVSSTGRSGLMVENISPQLGEFFGVKNGNGVLIRSVEKGSRADKAGFRAGDVIVKVNDQPVHDTSDFTHAVRSRSSKSVSVGVIRDKREQNLTLPLPERKESGELLEEESLDDHVIDVQSYLALGETREEIAKLRPQIEMATEEARKSAADLRETLCDQQKKMRDQAQKMKKEFRTHQGQFQRDQQKFKMEMDKMRLEMRRNWLDI